MNSEGVDSFVGELEQKLDGGLRTIAVGQFEAESYDIVYIRDDIAAQYSEEMREQIFNDLVLENLVEVRQQDLFPPLGGLKYTARVFDGGINVIGWEEDKGVFIGLDDDVSLVEPTISACRSEMPEL